jgi:SAM-dependent methyltransferase
MTEQESFEERQRRQIDAYHESALVYAAVRLGLPDTLAAGPLTAERLAVALGLSAPHLHRFLRGLCAIGICEERPDGAFALAPGGQSLKSDSPSRLAAKVQIVVGQYWRPWANLVSSLQTGAPAFDEVFGTSVSEWRSVNAAQGALFDSYLAKETGSQLGSIIAAIDLSGVGTVAILPVRYRPDGVPFDRSYIADMSQPFLPLLRAVKRVEFVAGDVLDEIPVEADLYLLNGVLQHWDDDALRTILRNCRNAMKEGARLVIVERLMPDRAVDDPATIMLDLHMMTITGGRARSLAEFEALLADAGLKLSNVTPTSAGLSVLEATLQ